MPYAPEQHHRRSIRLSGYDYASAGMYFVTICVQDKACLLGRIVDGSVVLSDAGKVADRCWTAIPEHFPRVALDAHIVMPNHLHGIILVDVGPQHAAPSAAPPMQPSGKEPGRGTPLGVVPGSLGAIVRSFKAAVTREVHGMRGDPGAIFWQRNYWEHIIRNSDEYERIYTYVISNPGLWQEDRLYTPL